MILFERSSLARACTNLSPYSHSFSLDRKMSNARAAIEHSQARRSVKNQQSVRNDSHVQLAAPSQCAFTFLRALVTFSPRASTLTKFANAMLRHCVALLAVLVAGQVAVHADDKGECTKAGYAAKFGALPVYDVDVHALEPTLDADDGTVALSVSYASPCGARSVFAASLMHKLGMDVILLERAAPSCEGVAEDGNDGSWPQLQHTVRVALPSEARGKQLFLAFPPDSVYEVYALGQWPLQLAANESIASPDALAGVGATGAARADAGAAAVASS